MCLNASVALIRSYTTNDYFCVLYQFLHFWTCVQGHPAYTINIAAKVTDGILEEVTTWQNRGLDSTRINSLMFLDCIHVKERDIHVIINKLVYLAIGKNVDGKKELLGIWIGKNLSSIF